MRRHSVLGTVALLLAASSPASAQEEAAAPVTSVAPAVRDHGELAAIGGYTTPPVRGGTTPFGFGGGARLGWTLSGVYLGGRVLGFLGGQDVDVTQRSVVYGGEAGYGFRADVGARSAFTLRPQVGLGGLTVFRTDPSSTGRSRRGGGVDTVSGASGQGGNTTTTTGFYVEPSLGVMFGSESTFIGATAGVLFVPSISDGGSTPSQWLGYTFALQLGLMF